MANASRIKAGGAFVEFFADDSKFQQGLRTVQARLDQFARDVARMGANFARMGAAITAPLAAAAMATVKIGSSLSDMAQRTGVGVEALSQLGYAAERTGANLDVVGNALFRMRRRVANAAEGTGPAVRALDALGLSAHRLREMQPDQQMKVIADALKSVGNESLAAQFAFEIFGDQAKALLPLLMQGGDGINALQRAADELGVTISSETAQAAADMADQMVNMKQVLRTVTLSLGGALLPLLKDAAQWVVRAAHTVQQWIKRNQDLVAVALTVGAALTAIGTTMVVLAKTIGSVTFAVGALTTALTFLAAHPVVLALGAIAAGVFALSRAFSGAKSGAAEFASEMHQMREVGDRMRSQHLEMIARLAELSQQQQLSNHEIKEAAGLIDQLTAKYGDLGIELDAVAGQINNVREAQQALQREMLKQQFAELLDELEARRKLIDDIQRRIALHEGGYPRIKTQANQEQSKQRLSELRQELAAEFAAIARIQDAMRALREGGGAEGIEVIGQAAEKWMKRIEQLQLELSENAYQHDLRLLQERYKAERELAEDNAEALQLVDRAYQLEQAKLRRQYGMDEAEAQWRRRVHQLQLQQIEDEFEREMQLLEERYAYELQKARDNAEAIQQIQRAKELEIQNLHERFRQRELEQETRAAEEAARHRQRIARLDDLQAFTVEELRLRATLEGAELEEALLDLRERKALEEAERNEQNLDLVREEFALRRQILQQQMNVQQTMDRFGAVGTFAARSMDQVLGTVVGLSGSPDDSELRTARNTSALVDLAAKADDRLRALVENTREGSIVFGP